MKSSSLQDLQTIEWEKTIAKKQRYKRMKNAQLGKVVQREETNKPERRDPNP
jgi:hypothetical protein